MSFYLEEMNMGLWWKLAMFLTFLQLFKFTAGQSSTVPPDLVESSCAGRCDEAYFPGRPCYCNEACNQYENCCFDYYELCAPDFVWSDDWLEYNNHLYKFFSDQEVTSSESQQQCQKHGGLLASINTKQEEEFLSLTVLRKRTLSAFIGGQDIGGTWLWQDGSAMVMPSDTWSGWYEGQPANTDGTKGCSVTTNYRFWEKPMYMISQYIWRSFSCVVNGNTVQGYICEKTLACDPNPCENNGTCLYVGGDMEYGCQCTENYVGDHCQYRLIEGALWTECGETNLLAGSDVSELTSPLYPLPYPPNSHCEWRISSSPGKTIQLSLEQFDIEEVKGCAFDSLTVYDGSTADDERIILGPVCGQKESFSQSGSFTTSGNETLVVFHSDSTEQKTGFSLQYNEQVCGQGVGDSGCGTKGLFTAQCGSILLEQPSRDEATPCEIRISVKENQIINLTFSEVHIYDSGKSCSEGALLFYDGSESTENNLIGAYCGFHFPWFVISTTNNIVIKLTTTKWAANYRVAVDYTAIEKREFTQLTPDLHHSVILASDKTYRLNTESFQANLIFKNKQIQRFAIKYQVGGKIMIDDISGSWNEDDIIRIYDGYSENSALLVQLSANLTENHTLFPTGFQIYVLIETFVGSSSHIIIKLQTIDVPDELSGCFRPYYTDRIDDSSKDLENHMVRTQEPVVVMVSEDAGYEPGMQCKWTLHGQQGHRFTLTFLDSIIPPLTDNCNYDGLVIQDGQDIYGPFCGSNSYEMIETQSSEVKIWFYSDTAGGNRDNGIMRLLVQDSESCPVYQMETSFTYKMASDCGVVLSPGFPGLVNPGLWTWTIDLIDKTKHFSVYVHYVIGPGVRGDCDQYFRVLEVAHDATVLKQLEGALMTVCGSTEQFIPDTRLRIPQFQKFGIELNTLSNSIAHRWQFKVSYTVEDMVVPDHMYSDEYYCDDGYHYFRQSCYDYLPWVYRHYQDKYSFQETWQSSLEYCTSQNGTFVSIHDEQEAYFLKYKFGNDWFWDKAGTYQTDTRLIFIGLNNKYGQYQWMDGTQLSYADWYIPRESWRQSVLFEDTLGTDFLELKNSQPTADVGSLCTALLVTSPFESLNWVKVPCDYPIYRAGLICKKNAMLKDNLEIETDRATMPHQQTESTKVCPEGWLMIHDKCLHLVTNYDAVRAPLSMEHLWNYDQAAIQCQDIGGDMAIMDDALLEKFMDYLSLWRHDTTMGHIWVSATVDNKYGNIIKVYKKSSLEEKVLYELTTLADIGNEVPRHALCQAESIDMKEERCRDQEFTCVADGSCISVDGVCDGISDCPDDSDEMNCDCGDAMYQCADGACIPISLYCDFRQDCHDGSDELNCVLKDCSKDEFRCMNGECVMHDKMCDFVLDCLDGSDEDRETCENQCNGMQCYSGACIHPQLQNDLVSDCPGLASEDEVDNVVVSFFDIRDGTHEQNSTEHIGCDDGSYVPCRQGAPRCYNRGRTCIYDTIRIEEAHDVVIQDSCRDGTHLRDMCEEHNCPGLFHCPGSFCLPHRKLCDGVKDCPDGADEAMSMCQEYTCPGLYRCKGESFCISHDEVCDGKVHCPLYRDDEKYCYSNSIQTDSTSLCMEGCTCVGNIIDCTNVGLKKMLTIPKEQSSTKALFLSHNRFTLQRDSLENAFTVGRIILSHNGLLEIPVGAFKNLHNLYDLDLSYNDIGYLDPAVFVGLMTLRKLNLNFNMLMSVSRETLAPLVSINHLIMTSNVLEDIEQDMFEDVPSMRVLNTDAYKFCCIAPQTDTCTPEADEFSSCEDLMANYTLQIAIWILGITAFFGNLFVIVWRIKEQSKTISAFYIINLGCSDFLMGLYLLIIAIADVFYRGRYIVHADSWRSGSICQTAGVLAMLSSEMSVFMLTAITLDRVINILFPLKTGNIRLKHARIVVAIGWAACFFLSVLPAVKIPYFGDAFFGRTGVCLPFQMTHEKQAGWEYSVFIFLAVNLASFLAILVGYVAIFWKVKMSVKQMRKMASSTTDEYALAKKLALIVATDFLCWVPIILIGIAALAGAKISPQVSAWIAVFILPLNSAVNPLIYTISAVDWAKFSALAMCANGTPVCVHFTQGFTATPGSPWKGKKSGKPSNRASRWQSNATELSNDRSISEIQADTPSAISKADTTVLSGKANLC